MAEYKRLFDEWQRAGADCRRHMSALSSAHETSMVAADGVLAGTVGVDVCGQPIGEEGVPPAGIAASNGRHSETPHPMLEGWMI